MSIGALINNKLIEDFKLLEFSNNNVIFNNVEKFYAEDTMESSDCLIRPISNDESTIEPAGGNIETMREYGFKAVVLEMIESSLTKAEGSKKYDRLMNTQDAILNYLQKEPSNLNAWGQQQNPIINIYKIRVRNTRFVTARSKGGYAEFLDIDFSVYLTVVPQNL